MDQKIDVDIMLRAYAMGIFPMDERATSGDLFWVDPDERGVFPLGQFHISRSLQKKMKSQHAMAGISGDFVGTINACADRPETWINDTLFDLYLDLHDAGFAHSLEVYFEDEIAGGVFGLTIGGAFFGESMYSAQRDGSKAALAFLIDHLKRTGFTLFDTQFLTKHLASLGAVEISRAAYHEHLEHALGHTADITSRPVAPLYDVLQRNTQTS